MDDTVNAKGIDEEYVNNNKVEGNAPIASSGDCSSEDDPIKHVTQVSKTSKKKMLMNVSNSISLCYIMPT
ncbi:hypothetical protein L1987_11175 [Smallanthus sonchifolius]|uniref:Uncharacterized protein n=1 Tax=Smallanthus sonchifolius TaxID=185202 RepID=A0ACB9JCU9_9ASTR|nr:hypothetical protein L1987_11175 [Smallanthus sonchifolius]